MLNAENVPGSNVEEEGSIDFRQYAALFLQWWWLIVMITMVAGAAAFFISMNMTPEYQATTTLFINEAPSTRATDYSSIQTSKSLTQTYAEMMKKRSVMEEVLNRLQIDMAYDEVLKKVTVSQIRDTQLITISAESTNPSLAAALANTIAEVFAEQLQQMQVSRFSASKESLQNQLTDIDTQISQSREALKSAQTASPKDTAEIDRIEKLIYQYEQISANLTQSYEQVRLAEAQFISSVNQIDYAVVPEKPVRPKKLQNTLLAAMVGLMLSVGGIFVYDLIDDTVKNPEEITRRFNLPVMGVISTHKEEGIITRSQPRSPVAESFRSLRTNVQFASVDHPIQTLLITSSAPAEGKSTVTANLAVVMAQGGRRVTLIDADLHRPRQHKVHNVERVPGLSSLFIHPEIVLDGAIQSTGVDSMQIIPAGELPPNPSELLGSNKMREILNVVAEQSDVVLIDTPPVLSLTDAVVLSTQVDGVLIVVRPGITKKAQLKAAVESLRRVGAKLVGVVLNNVDEKQNSYKYFYKSYYSMYKYYEADDRLKQNGKVAAFGILRK